MIRIIIIIMMNNNDATKELMVNHHTPSCKCFLFGDCHGFTENAFCSCAQKRSAQLQVGKIHLKKKLSSKGTLLQSLNSKTPPRFIRSPAKSGVLDNKPLSSSPRSGVIFDIHFHRRPSTTVSPHFGRLPPAALG